MGKRVRGRVPKRYIVRKCKSMRMTSRMTKLLKEHKKFNFNDFCEWYKTMFITFEFRGFSACYGTVVKKSWREVIRIFSENWSCVTSARDSQNLAFPKFSIMMSNMLKQKRKKSRNLLTRAAPENTWIFVDIMPSTISKQKQNKSRKLLAETIYENTVFRHSIPACYGEACLNRYSGYK